MQIAAGQLIAAVAANQASVTKGVETDSLTGSFPKVLIQMMAGSANGSLAANPSNPFINAKGIEMPGHLTMESGVPQENSALLEEVMLQAIQELEHSDIDETDLKQMEQILGQLNALLVSSTAPLQDEALATTQNQGDDNLQAEQSRPVLKELLQQLTAVVSSSAAKHAEHPLTPVVLQQLNALKHEILVNTAATSRPVKKLMEAVELSGAKIQFDSPVQTVHSHLQKLNHSANHVHLLMSLVSPETSGDTGSDLQLLQDAAKQTATDLRPQQGASGQTSVELRPQLDTPSDEAFVHSLTNAQEHSRVSVPAKLVVDQPVPVQEFAETMGNLFVKQLKLSNVNGISEAKLSLFPEQLGQVDVRITVHNGQVTALFMTESGLAKEMLDNQIAQLRSALQQQGLQVDKLEVAQSGIHSQLFKDGRHSGQGGRQYSEQNRSGAGGAIEGEFETELIEQAVNSELGYGRGINVTA
ncbi:flagellar hook-length control protein FliK [Paenibacillus tarimensis]